jgi:CelD/BcsL family acetyltransferase involved in cellulose biosynthesis
VYSSPKATDLGEGAQTKSYGVRKLAWERHDNLDAVREPWLRLQESAWTTPFQRIEWAERWIGGMGAKAGEPPIFILGRDQDGPAILLPLVLRGKGPRRRIAWLGDPANDYNVPLMEAGLLSTLDEDGAQAILEEVARLTPEASYLSLSRMPQKLNGLSNPFCSRDIICESDGFHLMEIEGSWADFERGRWSKNTRHRFRQKRNQLTRQGLLALRRMESTEEQVATTRKILEWKAAQLRARGSHNPFNPAFIAFLEDVASSDMAEIWALEFEGAAIAGIIGLKRPHGLLVYQIAYDNRFAKQSPGRLVMTDVADMLVARGENVLDFGFGDEEYKAGLATGSFPLYRRLMPLGTAGHLSCALERSLESARRFAKSSPLISRLYFTLGRRRSGETASAD